MLLNLKKIVYKRRKTKLYKIGFGKSRTRKKQNLKRGVI